MGLPGSRIASAVADTWGFTARVALRGGTTAAQAAERLPAIESALGLRPGSARVTPDPSRADRVVLRVTETDPLAAPVPWPGTGPGSVTRPVELGVAGNGAPVRVTVLRRNVLVGGTTGAGKSGVLNVILAVLTACPDAVIWGVDLKGGMELQPWAGCLDKLATTPAAATALLARAVGELDVRAAILARRGTRLWEPRAGKPALVVVVDEYAELPGPARDQADSLARRGRAVAVNLLAATQRPTQAAMGGGAVRSQMDVRICLRVRERRDADLILGQGALAAGWRPDTLTRPGEFLLCDPEHPASDRARAYLIDDAAITAHAATWARPAGPGDGTAPATPGWPLPLPGPARQPGQAEAGPGPAGALAAALAAAPPAGVTVPDLMATCGMGRTWVYARLRDRARDGQAVQVTPGHWRSAMTPGRDRG
jgi:S-DNA-T family DNA segregation ATPase FtsK/SpoIIIE